MQIQFSLEGNSEYCLNDDCSRNQGILTTRRYKITFFASKFCILSWFNFLLRSLAIVCPILLWLFQFEIPHCENTVVSPNFLVWKFSGNHSFRSFYIFKTPDLLQIIWQLLNGSALLSRLLKEELMSLNTKA